MRIDGTDIATLGARALRPLRRKVQIVFQDPYRSLNPRRTVGEAIIEGPLNYGTPRAEALERARKLLDLVRMDAVGARALPAPVLRRPAPAHLHRARAGDGARAAGRRRGGLGARRLGAGAGARSCWRRSATRLDLAMLFITHDLRVAAQVCDHVAVMSQGRVVEYGPAEQIFLRPQHEYTRALFEAAPGRDFAFGSTPAST